MQIYLDRTKCVRWQAACESCFSSRLTLKEFEIADCAMAVVSDGSEDITFQIKDRDGSIKTLVITPEEEADASDSWLLLWEKKEAEADDLNHGMKGEVTVP